MTCCSCGLEAPSSTSVAGEISDDEDSDLLAAIEERHRAGTFCGRATAYTVVGTNP